MNRRQFMCARAIGCTVRRMTTVLVTATPGAPRIRVVLANVPDMLRDILVDLLHGDEDIRVDHQRVPLDELAWALRGDPGTVVIIESGPADFARACDALPNVRLMAIAPNGRRALARFTDLSPAGLHQAIRSIARETVS